MSDGEATLAEGRNLERRAAITGIGQSAVGRRLNADPLALTADACLEAIADAGLSREDIDGVSTYPGAGISGAPGFTGAGTTDVQEMLRLKLNWFCGGPELPGQLGAVINACAAVATGLARHVLCFRTVWESTAQGSGRRQGIGTGGSGSFRAGGFMQWTLPYGAASAAVWIAMMARRHFHEFGTTREQMAQIALNARRNAGLNPKAIYREPMDLDDYMAARMISEPFCLYDCDAPVDGSTAVIVSAVDAARDCRRPPLRVEAVGSALRGRPSWDQFDDLTTMALRDASSMLWERTDFSPADVDVAELYDGFSFIAMAWLEALGFCGKGESGPFIEDGQAIALDGEIPLNTHGGQLSAGRLHGFGLLHEAALQLWEAGGARQVPGQPRLAVAAAGGGPLGGCLLLHRED
ncbi:MAG: thiolase family protein [Myxococcota bacterium]|nr:thiolase family protein [Myxococcota bacterium]